MMGPVLAGANATVTGCTFEYWMGFSADAIPFAEIVVTGSGATISGCSFTGNFTAYSWYNGSTCIGLDTTSDGATISDCTFTGGTNGLRVAGGTHVVEDCIFSNHRHTSASVIGGTLTARRCTATNNGHDGFNSETAGTTNLEHCLVNWTQETAAPISGAISGILFHANGSAYHCVVANLKRTTPGILPAYNLATTGNVAVKNCIAYNCVTGIGDSTDNTPPAGSYAQDYNCVNACTTAYQTGYAAGAHSISADPLFTNTTASSDDFHLLPASPCKNAGIAIAGVNDDYKGAAPDIGPYELASSAGKLTGAGRLGRWL
jgi:hypothetical protein